MPVHKSAMISSTSLDLPEHRKAAMDACLRQSFFPLMMEHLPASDDDAIRESLRMVDEANIYLGILAYRYGHVPKGHDISITEMEYNRAGERGIPRLMFAMHKDHPIRIEDVDVEGAEWCDGPPFAYHWGLEKAKAHLAALGAPEPVLPPLDESKYQPMPEIEIDPA